jgi:hypothetical protein
MQKYTYRDQVFTFEGCISVEEKNSWAMPWRIDFRQPGYYPGLETEAVEPYGVRLNFRTNSIELIIFIVEPHPGLKLGLFVDGLFIQEALVNASGQVTFDPLPPGKRTIEIWLDHRYPFKLEAVAIDSNAWIETYPIAQKRWLHYGGRNRQYEMAGIYSGLWSALVAKKLNLHLTNLSFEGMYSFEPMTARLIRDLPLDYVTAFPECKPDTAVFDSNLLIANLSGWIQIIREKHPDIPIALVTPSTGGFEMAETLARMSENCQMYGDHLVFLAFGSTIDNRSNKERFREKEQITLAERFVDEVFFKTFC